MRAATLGGLIVILTLSGCGPRNSPRFKALRPHLQPGVDRNELFARSGVVLSRLELARSQISYPGGRKSELLLVDLDGTTRDRKLQLTFREERLTGAALVRADLTGKITKVDEVLVEEVDARTPLSP
ncbi:MAG: hypothetical protein L0Z62_03980 [Gemmataceae bacterium]|nr:hypothetical protein [Gemmataceae bacterium]